MRLAEPFIGKIVEVIMDRPLGTKHPEYDWKYPVNYGFVPKTKSADGEDLDVYVLGVTESLDTFKGRCIAVIKRLDDDDPKLIVVPDGMDFTDGEIRQQIEFQEKFFKSVIIRNKYASRAGNKLAHALEAFKIDPKGAICADLGASTGGFTDVWLQHGASKVYAVEKGYGTIEWKIREDERVVVMERTNALHINLPEKVDFVSIDTNWTKQKLIVPKALELLKDNGVIVSLIKPHYESKKEELKKGKVPEEFLKIIVDRVTSELKEMNINVAQVIESPIVGSKGGNKEYLMLIKK